METSFRGCLFFVGIFPSRKTAFFLDADIKNSFSSRKTPLILDVDLENTFPSIKTAIFMDGSIKNCLPSTKLPIFMDRMSLTMDSKWSHKIVHPVNRSVPLVACEQAVFLGKVLEYSLFCGDGRTRTAVQTPHQAAFYTLSLSLIFDCRLPEDGLPEAYP